jgi:MATE family multidrug resistance protein
MGLTMALETLVSQAVGANKMFLIGLYVQRGGVILLIAYALVAPVGLTAGSIVYAANLPLETATLTTQYCNVAYAGLPFYFVCGLLGRTLDAMGNVKPGMYLAAVSLVVHAVRYHSNTFAHLYAPLCTCSLTHGHTYDACLFAHIPLLVHTFPPQLQLLLR